MSLRGVTKNFIHPYSLSESSSIRISINGAAALVHCFLRRSGAPACHSSGVTGSQDSWKQSQMAGPQPAHIQQVHEGQELEPAAPHKPPQQHAFPSPLSPLSPPGMRLAPKVLSSKPCPQGTPALFITHLRAHPNSSFSQNPGPDWTSPTCFPLASPSLPPQPLSLLLAAFSITVV